jgi:hypothetical protein
MNVPEGAKSAFFGGGKCYLLDNYQLSFKWRVENPNAGSVRSK